MKKQEIHGILKSDDVRHDRKAVLYIGIMKGGGVKMRAFLASTLGRLVLCRCVWNRVWSGYAGKLNGYTAFDADCAGADYYMRVAFH